MFKFLGIFVVVLIYSFSYAGGFYKWKDENGKIHITDYLPDGAEIISGDQGPVNRISGPTIQSGSNQGEGYASSDAQVDKNNSNKKLDAEIDKAKNQYDTCMQNAKGNFGNDFSKDIEIIMKRKECKRYMDIYENLIYSKQHNGFNSSEIKPNDNQNKQLDAEIDKAKNQYDTCIQSTKGDLGNDLVKNTEIIIKRKECKRYMDIYENLIYSKYNARKISNTSSPSTTIHTSKDDDTNKGGEITQKNTNIPPQNMFLDHQGGATDQYGTHYAPAGPGNMVNTKTGSQVIHQGGDNYLDTQTGRIIHGN